MPAKNRKKKQLSLSLSNSNQKNGGRFRLPRQACGPLRPALRAPAEMRRPRRRLGAREGGPGRVCGPYVVGVFWFRFFSVSSSASACFCFAAKRISTANSPENAHWFFSLSRMVSCGTRAAKELFSFARRARQWDRLATVFFSRPLPFSLTLDAVRRSLSTDETIPKKTGALYDVCNSDALSLLEQETFDRVYSLVR